MTLENGSISGEEMRKDVFEKSWQACQNGDIIQIRQLYCQLDSSEVEELLQRAISRSFLGPARVLLEQGASLDSILLNSAVEQCPVELLQLLSDFGAEFKTTEENLLIYATDRRDVIDWLLGHGLDINRGGNRTLKGRNKLYRDNTVAILNEAAASGDIDFFDHLVARGAIPSWSNALHHASRCSDSVKVVAMIRHLVKKYDLDVNADPSCGGLNELVEIEGSPGPPLNYAVTAFNLPAANTLLECGAKIGNAKRLARSSEMKEMLSHW